LTSAAFGEGDTTKLCCLLSFSRVLGVGIWGKPSSYLGDLALATGAAF